MLSFIDLATPLKVFGIAYKEEVYKLFRAYRSAYITKGFGIVVKEGGLQTI